MKLTPEQTRKGVLTLEMSKDEDRVSILDSLKSASDIQVVVDGVSYPVKNISRYQFAKPEWNRRVQKKAKA